jgi:hypothetical protein
MAGGESPLVKTMIPPWSNAATWCMFRALKLV